MPNAVAEAVGVKEQHGRPLGVTLADALSSRRLLIILDNCEYLVTACGDLAAEVVAHCPSVSVLVTSREALRIPAETLYPVPSLTVPDTQRLPPVEELRVIEAPRLFVERAMAASPRFTLDAQNAAAVAEICRRLDGLPLALELAAARVRMLTPAEIARHLGDRLLSSESRLAPPRQQTLRATIDWGYQLLEDAETRVLRRLSVFMGGWTLAAACVVCADEATGDRNAAAEVDPLELLDRMTGLVDKSFVFVQSGETETRYGMLETIREYAAMKLDEAGETTSARMRHRDWYVAMPERVRAESAGSGQADRLAKLEAEHGNLRAAIERSLPHAESAELGLRLATALWEFWYIRGHWREGFQTLECAIRAAPNAPENLRTAALRAACHLAGFLGELSRAVDLGTEAIELARELQDDFALSRALYNLANTERALGAYDRMIAHVEEGIVLARKGGRDRDVAIGLGNLGQAARDRGDNERAVELCTEALAIFHRVGDKQREAWMLNSLAVLMVELRDYDRASSLCKAARALAEELQDKARLADLCRIEGMLAREQGDVQAAWTLLGEALARSEELGDPRAIAYCARELAATATADGRPLEAARLLGSEGALRESAGWAVAPALDLRRNRYLAEARAGLGEEVFATAWEEGRAMRLRDAVAAVVVTRVGSSAVLLRVSVDPT